jgi:hypothetical protein
MNTALKHRSVLARTVVWGVLQLGFFLWVYPPARWIRRDTNVYFCFAAFALASLSITAVLPVLSRVSSVVRVLIGGMLAVAFCELMAATRDLWYQF